MKRNDRKLIEKLISNRGLLSTMLMRTVKDERTDLVRILLSLGADPFAKNKKGKSILDVAKDNKQWEIFHLLEYK